MQGSLLLFGRETAGSDYNKKRTEWSSLHCGNMWNWHEIQECNNILGVCHVEQICT